MYNIVLYLRVGVVFVTVEVVNAHFNSKWYRDLELYCKLAAEAHKTALDMSKVLKPRAMRPNSSNPVGLGVVALGAELRVQVGHIAPLVRRRQREPLPLWPRGQRPVDGPHVVLEEVALRVHVVDGEGQVPAR